MMMKFYQASILVISFFWMACSNKAVPLVSSMHTEVLHRKWTIQKMEGVAISPETVSRPFIDMTDVYHSFADAGCDKIVFTPKFGHQQKIEFAHCQVTDRRCKGSTVADLALLQQLQNAASWALEGDRLVIRNASGALLIEAAAVGAP